MRIAESLQCLLLTKLRQEELQMIPLKVHSQREIHVTCVFSEVCVLPCQFTKGRDEVIHWNKGTAVVHSFYNNTDQLDQQDPAYKNRTSMDKEQVAEGNASLSLQRTKLQDRGTYKCYCSTAQGSQESHVMVEVKGNPVHKWLWAVLVVAVAAIVIILAFINWRLRNREEGKNQQSDRQQKQQTKDNEQEPLEMVNKGNEQSDPEGQKLTSDQETQNPDST